MSERQYPGEARKAIPCTCKNPALHERECPYLLAFAPYGRCTRCRKALTLPPSMPGAGPDICGDCWRASNEGACPSEAVQRRFRTREDGTREYLDGTSWVHESEPRPNEACSHVYVSGAVACRLCGEWRYPRCEACDGRGHSPQRTGPARLDALVEYVRSASPTGWVAAGDLAGASDWEREAMRIIGDEPAVGSTRTIQVDGIAPGNEEPNNRRVTLGPSAMDRAFGIAPDFPEEPRRESARPDLLEELIAEAFGIEDGSAPGKTAADAILHIRALRKVAEAGRELVGWGWLHLLDESTHSRDVRTDVERLTKALEGVPQTSEEPKEKTR